MFEALVILVRHDSDLLQVRKTLEGRGETDAGASGSMHCQSMKVSWSEGPIFWCEAENCHKPLEEIFVVMLEVSPPHATQSLAPLSCRDFWGRHNLSGSHVLVPTEPFVTINGD